MKMIGMMGYDVAVVELGWTGFGKDAKDVGTNLPLWLKGEYKGVSN